MMDIGNRIPVLVQVNLECWSIMHQQDNGLLLVTFPQFEEIRPIAFPAGATDSEIQIKAKDAIRDAIMRRAQNGRALPIIVNKHSYL